MILIVDDDAQVRDLLARILSSRDHDCATADSVGEARRIVQDPECELVLCDMMMPGESGLDFLRELREQRTEIPVVMVSGVHDVSLATLALDLGAYGYVTKPFEANQVLIAVANALRRAELEVENASYRMHLEELVDERSAEVAAARDQLQAASEEMVSALSQAIEGRDVETGYHIARMSRYTTLIAARAGFDDEACEQIRLASPMHDVGKIAIADGILFKPAGLTPAERSVIEEHAELGYSILAKSEHPLLQLAATIARTHHERWDGDGYPFGLSGEAIPIEGRMTAIADVFDALVSRRVYKPAFSLERAVEIMREGRASQFDPELLDLFLDDLDPIEAIRSEYVDQ